MVSVNLWRSDAVIGRERERVGMGRKHYGKVLESAELSGAMAAIAPGSVEDAELTLIEQ